MIDLVPVVVGARSIRHAAAGDEPGSSNPVHRRGSWGRSEPNIVAPSHCSLRWSVARDNARCECHKRSLPSRGAAGTRRYSSCSPLLRSTPARIAAHRPMSRSATLHARPTGAARAVLLLARVVQPLHPGAIPVGVVVEAVGSRTTREAGAHNRQSAVAPPPEAARVNCLMPALLVVRERRAVVPTPRLWTAVRKRAAQVQAGGSMPVASTARRARVAAPRRSLPARTRRAR